jgi:Fe-S oxidoreductase
MISSPVNMYLKDNGRPKGAMKPMPNLMETELETFGAATVEDFTWKQLFDTDACTICGRCTSVCPAHATGKPLDPREIVLKVGEVMNATGSPPTSPPVGVDREIVVTAPNVFERITSEEIWACTTCKACDEICPVNIEILDKILDMRRYLSLMESDFPTELGNTYRAMENSGNAYGLNQGERGDWAASVEGVEIVEAGDAFDHEYLYFVGCAGSFDDRNKKTSRSLAKLLQRADIDFAILGPGEMCNGDQARRSGNEYIFQMLAMQNIETFEGMGVKKIITQCPHCFNVLKNEYPQLGGNYEVMHHSQLLDELVASGRLSLVPHSKSASPITTPAISAATTTCTSPPVASWARSPASTSSRCRATARAACAAERAARACGWRRTSARRSTTSAARRPSPPALPASPSRARSAT